jgi:hypothetical protein
MDTLNTPLVVYSNYPPTWYDATDMVPNSMRYYLIAEYIFKHYKPLGVLEDKSFWIKKTNNSLKTSLKVHFFIKKRGVVVFFSI